MQNKYSKLIDEAKIIACDSLKRLFKNLELDSELFDHLFDIKIKTSKFDQKDLMAVYISKSFTIILNSNYLKALTDEIKLDSSERMIKLIKLNLALTIVHEMLHANRTMMINNSLTLNNYNQKYIYELVFNVQKNLGYDLDFYNNTLANMNTKKYKKYVPIRVRKDKNNTVNAIVYNKESKNYEHFIINNFKDDVYSFSKNTYEFLKNEKPDCEIFNYGLESSIETASYYYHDFDKLILKHEEYSSKILDSKIKAISKKLNIQDDFEEVIIESIANVAIMSRKEENLNLQSVYNRLKSDESVDRDLKMGLWFISEMGEDMIKWFLTSAYESHYDDKFEKHFDRKYIQLLKSFSRLYKLKNQNSLLSSLDEKRIKSIVKQKKLDGNSKF